MGVKFDFGDLEAFLALYDLGAFDLAAERLSISETSLIRRIRKLEDALGGVLFDRTPSSLEFTKIAEDFRGRAQSILEAASGAVAATSDPGNQYSSELSATVTVAAIPTATHTILPRAIAAFRDKGHRGRIRISDLSASEVLDAVVNNEVDFGVNFVGSRDPALDFRPLMEDRFVLAMRRDDPLMEKTQIRWADIDPRRFIAVWKGSGNRMVIDNALARSRLSLDWAYETRHLSTALALVESGVGVTALPASAIPDDARSVVVARPLVDPDIVRTIGAVRRADSKLSPVAEDLFSVLLDSSAAES
jgi:DNA-binding transcriptional LysR family regulator